MGIVNQIKKDAIKTGSKVQDTNSQKLEGIFNKMFYLPKNVDEEVKFIKQVMTRGLETQERKGLHASAMIVSDNQFCLRQQVLSLYFKQLQGEQLPPKTMRIFEEGNAIHEKWQRLFIRAGYGKARTMDRTRMDWDYNISYTPDGVVKIPEFFPYPMVLEIKSVNPITFKKMVSHPSAFKQMQFYMFLLIKRAEDIGEWNGKDYTKGIVLCDDKGMQDFKTFVYDYDESVVAPIIERCEEVRYFYNNKKVPKKHKDCDSSKCKLAEKCPMRDACWNIGMGRVKL